MVVKVTVTKQRSAAAASRDARPAAGAVPSPGAGCGPLLGRLARAANRALACELGELGLRSQQFSLLHLLADTGPLSQADLAGGLRVHASNLVRVLDELEDEGLLARERDPADRRRQLVVLTEAGAEILARADRIVAETERELLSPLSPDEQAQLRELLGRLAANACSIRGSDCSG